MRWFASTRSTDTVKMNTFILSKNSRIHLRLPYLFATSTSAYHAYALRCRGAMPYVLPLLEPHSNGVDVWRMFRSCGAAQFYHGRRCSVSRNGLHLYNRFRAHDRDKTGKFCGEKCARLVHPRAVRGVGRLQFFFARIVLLNIELEGMIF